MEMGIMKALKVVKPADDSVQLKPPFKRAAEIERLIEFYFDQPIGTITPYRRIGEIIGEDPQGKGRSILYRARLILIRDYQIVIDVITNVGTQRLSDTEIVQTSTGDISKLRRATQRYSRKLGCAKPDRVAQELRSRYLANISLLGAIQLAISLPAVRQVADRALQAGARINPGQLFEVLSRMK
jgi:hypothetical protein